MNASRPTEARGGYKAGGRTGYADGGDAPRVWGGEGKIARQIFQGQTLYGRNEDERDTDAVLEARQAARRRMPSLRGDVEVDPDKYRGAGGYGVDKDDYKRGGSAGGGENWISGAIKHPGALHRQLGVPEGEKIPAAKIDKAAQSSNPTLAKRARLAQTLKGLRK